MAAITYTISNLSQNNETAIINVFEIQTNLSEQQHYLNLSGWNLPFNAPPYTNFTGSTTRRTETKTFQGDIKSENFVIESFTGTSITFTENVASAGVASNWTVTGNSFQSGQTIDTIVTNTVTFVGSFDNDPEPGEIITFTPPEFLLFVNNVNNLQIGWEISGNGYSGQNISNIIPPNTLVISEPASTEPQIGQLITFQSNYDNMFEIAAGQSKTFSMDYSRVTSTLGTYTSLVKIYATLGGTEIIKNVNNFMVISLAPVIVPDSPYYFGGDGGDGPGIDCGDTADGSGCSI